LQDERSERLHDPDEEVHHEPAARPPPVCASRTRELDVSIELPRPRQTARLRSSDADACCSPPDPPACAARASWQVVDVLHPGVAGIAKTEMREKLAKLYKVRPSAAASRLQRHVLDARRLRAADAHSRSPVPRRASRRSLTRPSSCSSASSCLLVVGAARASV
jgi:hypothetical protein